MNLQPSATRSRATAPARRLTCRLCGYEHHDVALPPGGRALCAQCGGLLARRSRFSGDAALALTCTGLVLAVPSLMLPFVTVDKFGSERMGYFFTGVEALWQGGKPVLATWVLLCGGLVPLFLLGTLLSLLISRKLRRGTAENPTLKRTAHALAHWAMPEVYVLAVLVALTKLGTLVNVSIGPGFWSYSAMAVVTLAAWRSYILGVPTVHSGDAPSGNGETYPPRTAIGHPRSPKGSR